MKIHISGPTKNQKKSCPKESGGLWITFEGGHAKSIKSSTVKLPEGIIPEKADSLNHAFTLLSEKYEPWRKSHTGNVYSRMFFLAQDEKWHPLDVLR